VVGVVDDQILVINDEQPHSGLRKSFPGGRIDSTDISVEDAARREVHEETGYSFNKWRLIRVWQPHTKIEWFINLLLAWDVSGHDQPHLDPGEKITIEKCSFPELKTLILNKTGYLGDAQDTFAELSSIEELLGMPEYNGKTVDR
jgi:8-oxo-dGTP pyrophosphatase MutT (NUDIX family)